MRWAHSWVTVLFGHSWHIFDNETRQLVIVYLFTLLNINIVKRRYNASTLEPITSVHYIPIEQLHGLELTGRRVYDYHIYWFSYCDLLWTLSNQLIVYTIRKLAFSKLTKITPLTCSPFYQCKVCHDVTYQ
jgi:hypothetical protein